MPRRIAIIFLAIIVSPLGIKCRAENRPVPVPYCVQSDLDIDALPPTNSSPFPSGHLLVFEIQNIGKTSCRLNSPIVQPLPKLSEQDEIESKKLNPDGSLGYAQFDQIPLAPDDWVHVLMAWGSVGHPYWPQCLEYSGLNLLLTHGPHGVDQVSPVSVEVRNLQMRSCGGVFLSDYRKGRYSSDSAVADKWLNNGGSGPGASLRIPRQATSLQNLKSSPLFKVSSKIKRILLESYFSLDLKVPGQADNLCDFRSLRKRESDGTTVISFQNCPESSGVLEQSLADSSEPIQTWVDIRALGMLPKNAGPVAYDLVADLGNLAAPSLAKAHIDLVAHDPTPPAQATIVNPVPDCTESQLEISSPSNGREKCRKVLRAYEATNVSDQACSVAGVPEIRGDFPFDACPNCVNDLFVTRPNGRIDLQPGKTAHFLVGTETLPEEGDSEDSCHPVKMIELALSQQGPSVKLSFDGRVGDTLDVSAWREGKFDNDPLNIQWAKTHPPSTDPTNPIPSDCNKPELLSRGKPMITPRGKGYGFGLSLAKHEFKAGEGVTLHIWIDNTSDVREGVMTCMGLDHFKATGFDLYDAYGHRLLRRDEAKILEECKDDPDADDPDAPLRIHGWSCTRNFPIYIPAHTCVTSDDYDFTAALTASYDLPPGEYTVRPRPDEWRDHADVCKPQPEQPFHPEPGKDLTFSVVQP